MLILAGAGSGKTRVLTTKIAHLIREKRIPEHRILAITFTNKAAREMKERIAKMLPEVDADRMWMGTFHSMCARILRRHIEEIGYRSQFTIYDRDDQKSVLKEILKEQNVTEEQLGYKLNSILSAIGKAKNSRISPAEYEKSANFGFTQAVADLYPRYERKLKENSALDFDDLILKTLELFEKNEELQKKYADRFLYVFVDEYQDTNRMQYDLVKALSSENKNLCVVGDIDQSIYKFRGADIQNILDFEKDYPNARVIQLEQNYRSTQNILRTANRLIGHNEHRREKNLWTDNGEGAGILYRETVTSDDEAASVMEWIEQNRTQGVPYEEMAILYRTNAQSRSFEELLRRLSIPYRLVGGFKFYDRKEVRDIGAYLSALVNPDDAVSVLRVINLPKRGIGQTSLDRVRAYAFLHDIPFREALEQAKEAGVAAGTASKIDAFLAFLQRTAERISDTGLTDLVKTVAEESGYLEMLRKSGRPEDRTRLENIDEFISSVAAYEEMNPEATLEAYLQEVSLLSDADKADDEESGVNLMTVHSAKGTEYDVVFLTGMEQGLFPSQRAMEDDDLEEERRLCYVAITRARKKLYVTGSQARRQYGQFQPATPSLFIEEMGDGLQTEKSSVFDAPRAFARDVMRKEPASPSVPTPGRPVMHREKPVRREDPNQYRTGDRIAHDAWGEGMVVQVADTDDDQVLTLSFPAAGLLKKVKKSYAKLRRLD